MAIWGAVASAAIGGAIGLFGQSQSNKAQAEAARKANKENERIAKAQYERALQEWKLDYRQQVTNYYWEQALTEQIRKVEAQAAVDQAQFGTRLLETAAANYRINASALFDEFVTSERLRWTSETMQYDNTQTLLGLEDAQIQAQTQEAVAQYMSRIAENGSRANLEVARREGMVEEAMTALAAQEAQENYAYQAQIIAQGLDAAVEGNRALARGGGNSAKQVAMNRMKAALREYGRVELGRQARAAKVGNLNYMVNKEGSMALAVLAKQSERAEAEMEMMLQTSGVRRDQVAEQMRFNEEVFNRLTIPSFQLAGNQYQRELQSLQVETRNLAYNATLPYRQREVFDPLKPIAGLKPEYYAPSKVYAPSNSFGSLATGFLQGAQSFSPSLFNTVLPNAINNLFGG